MESFEYEIEMVSGGSLSAMGEGYQVRGTLLHRCPQAISIGRVVGHGRLELGFRIYRDSGNAAVFEDVAHFDPELLSPMQPYPFQITIPSSVLNGKAHWLLIDLLCENEFRFVRSGGSPFAYLLEVNGEVVRVTSAPHQPPSARMHHAASSEGVVDLQKGTEKLFSKYSPDLLPALVESLQGILSRYGAVLAVEFAYLHILGRSADPRGLTEKSIEVSANNGAIADICADMLRCSEYQSRNILWLRDPRVVIQSWAELLHPETRNA